MRFDMSWNVATALNGGFLVPVGFQEVLPGDFWRGRSTMFLRASPLARPLLHSVLVDLRSFFVPYRLLWSEWEAFRNQEVVGAFPTITLGASAPVVDYLGASIRNGEVISALPVRAYNLIVNKKYYSGLPAFVVTDRAQDDVTVAPALWPRDYFTGARSQPQLGPGESVPITISAGRVGVDGIGLTGTYAAEAGASRTYRQRTGLPDFNRNDAAAAVPLQSQSGVATPNAVIKVTGAGASMRPDVSVDLTNLASVTGVSLADLRRAVASQDWKELRARIGPDYADLIRAMGARSSDLRLREPEYLGGGRRRIAFSEVLATAESASVQVGEMFGHGLTVVNHDPWSYYAAEDGCIITLASVRPAGVYAQALPRAFSRITEPDFWSPQRAGIGDQPILNKEIYAAHATPNGVFGYQDRHGDYMRAFDMVTDTMRNVTEMQFWHLARIFTSDPALNGTFLQCQFPQRVFQDQVQRNFVAQVAHDWSARRPVNKDVVL